MLPLLALNKLRPTGYNNQIQRIFFFVKSRLNLKISKDLERASSLEPCLEHYWPDPWHYFVSNKAKGRISKRVFQENKAHQIFRKTSISYPLFVFRGIWRALFSWNNRFEILSFVWLPTIFSTQEKSTWCNGAKTHNQTCAHVHAHVHTCTHTQTQKQYN